MADLSIFVDESGAADSKYYLLTLVFHDQERNIAEHLDIYTQSLAAKGLPDIPFHASPLMNGHDGYEGMPMPDRKRLFYTFFTMFRHLPIRYQTLWYRKDQLDEAALGARMRRDIVNLMFDRLEFFQSFDAVKIYYDNGQKIVTRSIRDAAEYALGKSAVLYRKGDPGEHRLAQAADLICTVELTELKHKDGSPTATDLKMFGARGNFRKNILRIVRAKLL